MAVHSVRNVLVWFARPTPSTPSPVLATTIQFGKQSARSAIAPQLGLAFPRLLCRERRQGIDGFAELTGPNRVGG
jgi:hypothetical protein